MMTGMEVHDGPTRVGSKRHYSRSGNTWVGAGGRPHTPQVCRYWQEGRCLKGDDCQWLHPGNAGTTGRGSPAGNGKRANNVVDHRDNLDRDYNSRDVRDDNAEGGWGYGGGDGFLSGSNPGRPRNVSARWGRPRPSNRAGQQDPRVHDGSAGAQGPPCSFWLKGNCTRGDTCKYLHAHTTAPDVELMTQLIGHDKAIRAIVMPEGLSQLYTGGQDETVRVWDCSTGQCINVVKMSGGVGSLLSVPGWLFVGLPNEVQTWNMATSAQQSLSGPKGQVHALAVNGEGILFAGTQDGTILAWKLNSNTNQFEPAASLSGHTGPVITLLSLGSRLYSGSMDHTIRVWELVSGQCIQTLENHANVVMDLLCWEPFLLSCSLDGTVKVWAANTAGQLEMSFSYPEEEGQPDPWNAPLAGALKMCGCRDRAGKPVLLCSYNDNTVRLYDLPSFTERGLLFSKGDVRALKVGPGQIVVSGDSRGTVKVWHWPETPAVAVAE